MRHTFPTSVGPRWNMNTVDILKREAVRAALRAPIDQRYMVGAAGLRVDGAIVHAHNTSRGLVSPDTHAEARLLRRLGQDAPIVVVARWMRSGRLGLAAPCRGCVARLRARGVRIVWFTTDDGWAKMNLESC